MSHSDEQDDAKVAARWLWGFLDNELCQGGESPIRDAAGAFMCPRCLTKLTRVIRRERDYIDTRHHIPPPDFADPAVYDRALDVLADWDYAPRLEFLSKWTLSAFIPMGTNARIRKDLGRASSKGAAIAAAIAELARANDARGRSESAEIPQKD